MNLVYAGTPDFAVPALRRLIDEGYDIVGVYTQPDRAAGRGRKPRPSPVKQLAEACGLPVFQPETFKDVSAQGELAGLEPDVMVVAAYGLLLPQPVLEMPRHGCINIHASLLPRWRGAAPIQRALLAGESETGVTLMQMEAGLDTGPMLEWRVCEIGEDDTAGDLHDRLAELGAQLLAESLPAILDGTIKPTPQNDADATYAPKLSKDEAVVDWAEDAEVICRRVRAFNPWPVAQARFGGQWLRIWRASAMDGNPQSEPGEVLAVGASGIDVAAGRGVLRLLELQAPGGRRLAASDFLNGHPIARGDLFS
ncbi:methionyl-tRNA formyltransferase [Ectothiorhodospiraceae bacterium WFHF3C12]|nr:methionyl-tRNA formyltransferase [Ectothiorhodospiraceae bacterium WFHF3C12]